VLKHGVDTAPVWRQVIEALATHENSPEVAASKPAMMRSNVVLPNHFAEDSEKFFPRRLAVRYRAAQHFFRTT